MHYVSVQGGSGCWSLVGKSGGRQPLNLGNGCTSHATIAHEFIHAFGFLHEQNRPDSREYVNFHKENLSNPSLAGNFVPSNSATLTFTKYDGLSIMHYASDAFAFIGKKTLVPKVTYSI